jgi:DNA-binding GntR family transcriptional regulator
VAKQARTIAEPAERVSEPRPRSLTEQLYERIKDEILRVEWEPGELLLESVLAQRYEVSKTPVREALRLLLQDGWVVVLPRKGYLVRAVTLADVREVFLLRAMLEPGLVREMGHKAGPSDVDRLADAVARQRAAGTDVNGALQAAREFHQIIAETAHLRRGRQIVTTLADEVRRFHHLMPRADGRAIADANPDQHDQIVTALRAGDVDAAAVIMRDHISDLAEKTISDFGNLYR